MEWLIFGSGVVVGGVLSGLVLSIVHSSISYETIRQPENKLPEGWSSNYDTHTTQPHSTRTMHDEVD